MCDYPSFIMRDGAKRGYPENAPQTTFSAAVTRRMPAIAAGRSGNHDHDVIVELKRQVFKFAAIFFRVLSRRETADVPAARENFG
jgi:hypothetical protein